MWLVNFSLSSLVNISNIFTHRKYQSLKNVGRICMAKLRRDHNLSKKNSSNI